MTDRWPLLALVMQREGEGNECLVEKIKHIAPTVCLPVREVFGERVSLIRLVSGCNYQPHILTGPFFASLHVHCVSFVFRFSHRFFFPPFFVPHFCLLIPAD